MNNLKSEITNVLSQDERVLWVGHPYKSFIFRQIDILLVPFSLMWSYAILRGFSLSHQPNINIFLFGTFTAYFVFGRFVIDYFINRSIVYVLTDTRILISYWFLKRRVKSYPIKSLSCLELNDFDNDISSIWLNSSPPFFNFLNSRKHSRSIWSSCSLTLTSLYKIENAQSVYRTILEIKQNTIHH